MDTIKDEIVINNDIDNDIANISNRLNINKENIISENIIQENIIQENIIQEKIIPENIIQENNKEIINYLNNTMANFESNDIIIEKSKIIPNLNLSFNDNDNDNDNYNDDNDNKKTPKTFKEQKKEKIHNHSKPKTIIASTQDVNTVDMFGEDDLDFRYVMMNYDYTKNVTMPKITKYERALLIGKRAKQIEEGANPNVKYISGQSVVSIAEEELRQRKIPLIIKRPIGNKFEYWIWR